MELHETLVKLRQQEKQVTSEILEKLQQMEDQRGYLVLGYSSLFDYLVRGLGYSEATAYQRQACVRLAKEIPEIKEKIDRGVLSASAVTAVYKHIRKKPTKEKRETLKAIENKSSREVRRLFAEPPRPIKIKKAEYKDKVYLRLELSLEQNNKIEKLKALKSHKFNLEGLFEELVDKELKAYTNTTFKPSRSKNPRCISKRLRNHVLERARHQCQYPGCEETHYLQIDHIHPVRQGGQGTHREPPDTLRGSQPFQSITFASFNYLVYMLAWVYRLACSARHEFRL